MGKYGSGVSLVEMAELEKDCVRQAGRGFLVVGQDGEGEFIYDHATPEECEEYILGVIDHWYYVAKQGADAGRAFEQVLKNHGLETEEYFFEFAAEFSKAQKEYDFYVYEFEKKELQEEAEDTLKD